MTIASGEIYNRTTEEFSQEQHHQTRFILVIPPQNITVCSSRASASELWHSVNGDWARYVCSYFLIMIAGLLCLYL